MPWVGAGHADLFVCCEVLLPWGFGVHVILFGLALWLTCYWNAPVYIWICTNKLQSVLMVRYSMYVKHLFITEFGIVYCHMTT